MPIAWEELAEDVRFDSSTCATPVQRLTRQKRDPWAGFLELRQRITPAMLAQLGVRKPR
jgi:bifunctional non-homologous end joining protein LigD